MLVPQFSPILIFIRVQPASCQAVICSSSWVGFRLVKPPDPYTGTVSRTVPSRAVSGTSRMRALRSHRAMSTALMACMTRPRVPRFRQARCIADQHRSVSAASSPVIAGVRWSWMTCAAAGVL